MKITIHRGTKQIGGNCVEIATESTRLIIDIGLPLEALLEKKSPNQQEDPLIRSVFAKEPPVAAVLLSHAHADHTGLLKQVPSTVPIYLTDGTSMMLKAGSVYAGYADVPRERQRILDHRVPVRIGDMATEAESTRAISVFSGKDFKGRALTVNEARPREERSGGFGGGGGYRGGGSGGRR
jgi:ribonuclease J